MLQLKLRALIFPEGVLLAAAVALVHWGAAAPSAAPVVRAFPVVVLIAGTLLAWRFRRGRLVVALVALALADLALLRLTPLDPGRAHAGPAVVRAVAILLPVTFAVLSVVDERSLLTAAGLRRMAALAVPAALVIGTWVVSNAYPKPTARAINAAFLPGQALARLPLGQAATVVAGLALAVLVFRAFWHPDYESRGLLWAAVAGVIAASAVATGGHTTLYLAGGGLVLVVASVESAYTLAYHDELTGLPGRRALTDALKEMGRTYTIAMVDVDRFKGFNDEYGHGAGDQVLRLVATCLRSVGPGRAFRYGGEEFAVLFPGKGVVESAPSLERLRRSVAEAAFMVRGPGRPKRKPKTPRRVSGGARRVVVTVSIGAAEATDSTSSSDVLKSADQALYRAKRRGRNRVDW